uniref:Neprilysin n=1 Tax=Panagrellus redivivus TaxID=6233 RepID=A0A7E4ZX25_PANRE
MVVVSVGSNMGFFKVSAIIVSALIVLTVGMSIAMLIIVTTQGGSPSVQEMCDDMPGMCIDPNNPNPTGAPTSKGTYAPPTATQSQQTSQPLTTSNPNTNNAPYQIHSSPGYDWIAKHYLTSVNFSADPCEDFFAYACGQWPSQHTPPQGSESDWTEYSLVSRTVSEAIQDAIESVDLSTASDGIVKTRHFYDTCLNSDDIEAAKGTKLGSLLHTGVPEDPSLPGFPNNTGRWALIDKDYADSASPSIESQIARLKSEFGIDTYFLAYALQYDLNSAETILWLTPTMLPLGMGMFTQGYYLKDKYQKVRDAYSQLQKDTGTLLARDSGFGVANLDVNDLKNLLQLEINIANLTYHYSFDIEMTKPSEHITRMRRSMVDPESNDDSGNNDLWDLPTIKTKIPNFNWDDYLKNLVSADLWQRISVNNEKLIWIDFPEYFNDVEKLIKATPARDVRNYNIWRLVKYSLPYMSTEYRTALGKFNNAMYGGMKATTAAQKNTCLSYIKGNYEMPNLSFATAEAMIRKGYFPVDAKKKATDIVATVKSGLLELIKNSAWMDDKTKAAALTKAGKMDAIVAYPEWVLNTTAQALYYNDLQTPKASFISLNLMLRGWAVRKQLSAIGIPVDRGEFIGTPVATDAWYSQSTNALTVPLGELQAPFFGMDFPAAVNYGGAGAVFGHEMSHGFDQTGRQFDAYGNETDWWSPASEKAFDEHCVCISDQFSNYCYNTTDAGEVCINGNNTINENIADLAGLKAAFTAYKAQDAANYRLAAAPMWNDDQLFFLSFASFWCGVESDAAIVNQVETDVHSTPKYRVIGTLRNVPEFAKTWQCGAKAYMNPSDRCTIW